MWLHSHNWCDFTDTTHWCFWVMDPMLVALSLFGYPVCLVLETMCGYIHTPTYNWCVCVSASVEVLLMLYT